jgi:hypothetical protein
MYIVQNESLDVWMRLIQYNLSIWGQFSKLILILNMQLGEPGLTCSLHGHGEGHQELIGHHPARPLWVEHYWCGTHSQRS